MRLWNFPPNRYHRQIPSPYCRPFPATKSSANWAAVVWAWSSRLAIPVLSPQVDPRFFEPAETQAVAADCYELLLIDAQALAQPRVGEPAGEWRGRLHQALARLDRADRLGVAAKTHSGLTLRAEYLDALGKAGDLAERPQAAEAARKAAEEADRVATSLVADFFLVGLSLSRQDQFEQALKPLDNALLKQPDHFGARYLRAVCLSRLKRHAQARDALTECLRQQPDFFWPHLLRGYAEMELKDFTASQADFNEVLKRHLDPAVQYVALVDRGVLLMKQGRMDDAQADFLAAVKMRPEWTAAYINLALTQRQRGEELARSAAPAIGPASAEAAVPAVADAMMHLGDWAGAALREEAGVRIPAVADVVVRWGDWARLTRLDAPAVVFGSAVPGLVSERGIESASATDQEAPLRYVSRDAPLVLNGKAASSAAPDFGRDFMLVMTAGMVLGGAYARTRRARKRARNVALANGRGSQPR